MEMKSFQDHTDQH